MREFVENALDAAEAALELPEIELTVEELDAGSFDDYRRKQLSRSKGASGDGEDDGDEASGAARKRARGADADTGEGDAPAAPRKTGGKSGEQQYYRITCRDNGCGMPHASIPDMLGRVLAGSKYGVRQTRGKFGLGAKMALIWSKKSTGLPIEVKTAHRSRRGTAGAAPRKVSTCVLDIDIYRNVPHVLEHVEKENEEAWLGTRITAVISGAWSTYRARILQYFQQLAVITPYAQFTLHYRNASHGTRGKGDFSFVWKRRSTAVPEPPVEVKHHPSAVNDLLITQLMDVLRRSSSSGSAPPSTTLAAFLTSQFQCIDSACAASVIAAAGDGLTGSTKLDAMTPKHVHDLRVAMDAAEFPAPRGDCLSPAGEYNLRLGVLKELRPDMVATASSPVGVYQGHPFIVEAAVALGGRGPDGLTVHRFANRIPLLFEGGADVATQTAMKRISWSMYKIDPARDKVSVFVSLVSTKIPFKGTGKEYIGDDVEDIRAAVKSCIQACCSQLRVKLLRASSLRAKANRKKLLVKYIPDVCRAVLAHMKSLTAAGVAASSTEVDADALHAAVTSGSDLTAAHALAATRSGALSEGALTGALQHAVDKADLDAALEQAASGATSLVAAAAAGADDAGHGGGSTALLPAWSVTSLADVPLLHGDIFAFRMLPAVSTGLTIAAAAITMTPAPVAAHLDADDEVMDLTSMA